MSYGPPATRADRPRFPRYRRCNPPVYAARILRFQRAHACWNIRLRPSASGADSAATRHEKSTLAPQAGDCQATFGFSRRWVEQIAAARPSIRPREVLYARSSARLGMAGKRMAGIRYFGGAPRSRHGYSVVLPRSENPGRAALGSQAAPILASRSRSPSRRLRPRDTRPPGGRPGRHRRRTHSRLGCFPRRAESQGAHRQTFSFFSIAALTLQDGGAIVAFALRECHRVGRPEGGAERWLGLFCRRLAVLTR